MSEADDILKQAFGEGVTKAPDAAIKPAEVVSLEGKPIEYGKKIPGIIGADDTPIYKVRTPQDYPDLPQEIKNAEHQFVLPVAQFIANTLGITVLDEKMYESVLPALKSRSLFVVLNLYKAQVADGTGQWDGLVLMCKRHPVVLVRFKMQLSTQRIGIAWIKTWNAHESKYYVHGDREQRKLMPREEASTLIINYLRHENIVPTL